MTRVRKPAVFRVPRKPTSAPEQLLEDFSRGYGVRIQRTPSGAQIHVVANPNVDISHLLEALHRAHPAARIRVSRRQ